MRKIEGYDIQYDFSGFKKIADLIFFEGPLLSHYVSEKGDDYLFYWVDRDEADNRWLVLRVSLANLQKYIAKELTLLQLIESPNDGYLYTVDVDNAASFCEHLLYEGLVHRCLPAMSVKMACGEFHGLTEHHAEGNILDVEFMGDLQRLADIVAVFHERLLGQVRIKCLDEPLALAATVDDYTFRATCLCHRHAFTDTVDKSLFRERFDNA